MNPINKLKTSVLYAYNTPQLSYFDDWLDAFTNNNKFALTLVNAVDNQCIDKKKLREIENSELIVLLHSMTGDSLTYLKRFKSALSNRKGTLISFVGNEVNLPLIGMQEKITLLKELAPEIIATQLLEDAGKWLYSECLTSNIVSIPHALNQKVFYATTSTSKRPIDFGTRSATYGVYLGDNDRNAIIHYFQNLAWSNKLHSDLNTTSRFTRNEWAAFLNQCKATISTEAGTFYLEKNDKLIKEILDYLKLKSDFIVIPNENSFLRHFYKSIVPSFIRTFIKHHISEYLVSQDALGHEEDFTEIWAKFFQARKTAPVYTKCISSRHFDAAGTKTLQIMFPGRFNDILLPHIHYVPVKKDFSNIDEVLSILYNPREIERITTDANTHIKSQHTYQHRMHTILSLL